MPHSKSMRQFAVHSVAVGLYVVACPAQSNPTESTNDTATDVEAIWHVQSVPFLFKGMNVFYTCEGFQKKVRAILTAVGAHPSMIVQVGCAPKSVTDRIHARIALATPVPASEANIQAETTVVDKRRELLARVQKTPMPTESSIERFYASSKVIVLDEHTVEVPIEPSDCELLFELDKQIFPKIGVEMTSDKLFCSPIATRQRPVVEVRALMPTIQKDVVDASRQGAHHGTT